MSRHRQDAPTQRQLRVAEQMRHVLAEGLMRGELSDPRLDGRSLTVGEVRVSRDLRTATVFVAQLGGALDKEALAALAHAASRLGGQLARTMNLKYAPRLRFVADGTYAHAAHMERLLQDQRAQLRPQDGDDGAA